MESDELRQIMNAMSDLSLGPATLDGVLDALNDLQRLRHLYPPLLAREAAGCQRIVALETGLRGFYGCAYPVATEINKRGWNWRSERSLDEALIEAATLLDDPQGMCPATAPAASECDEVGT